jgi:hypothetical protein
LSLWPVKRRLRFSRPGLLILYTRNDFEQEDVCYRR